jgi:hypothetical protein
MSNSDTVISFNRTKVAVGAAAALLLCLISAALFVTRPDDEWDMRALHLGGAVLFGTFALIGTIHTIRPKPAVVINDRGIDDRASAMGVGFLAWDEIAEVRTYTFLNQVCVGIMPKHVDALLARQPLWKRLGIRANLATGGAAVNIPQGFLSMSAIDLHRIIGRRFPNQPGDHATRHLR